MIDFCVYAGERPTDVPTAPPVVAAEILSEDESMSGLLDKMQEYKEWGVRHAWVLDPKHRQMYVYDDGLRLATALAAPEVGLEVLPDQLFR